MKTWSRVPKQSGTDSNVCVQRQARKVIVVDFIPSILINELFEMHVSNYFNYERAHSIVRMAILLPLVECIATRHGLHYFDV